MRVAPLLAVLPLFLPALLPAQNSQCSPYASSTRRVCDAAIDGTRAFHPVAGLLVSGGNPVLGTANTLGGLGHFAVTARVNAVNVVFPDVGYDGSSTTVPSSEKLFAPALLPAVSVSLMRRDIPRLSYGDLAVGDQYRYAVNLHATNLRLVASKQLALLGVAGGLGWDKYTGDATIQFRDPATSTIEPAIPLDLSQSRALAFVDLALDLSAVKLAGEAGYQFGKDQGISTDFEDFDDTSGKFFAGLGLRLSF